MASSRPSGGRRGSVIATAVTALLLAVGLTALAVGMRGPSGPPQAVASSDVSALTGGTPGPHSGQPSTPPSNRSSNPTAGEAKIGPFLPASAPVALDIPSIGIHSRSLVGLHVGTDGALQPPRRFDQPGWYIDGPTPGQLGPAVIGGHVDSTSGPAVFYRLGALRPGALVKVGRRDRSVATFVIDKVARYPKAHFPTEQVYGNVDDRADIRLITCGGTFNRRIGHYNDNVVAFGHLVS
jgi:hypothetical protein